MIKLYFFLLCIRKHDSKLLVNGNVQQATLENNREDAQCVVTWRPILPKGGRLLPSNFVLGICHWMGRMFTAGLRIKKFHFYQSRGRTFLRDFGVRKLWLVRN